MTWEEKAKRIQYLNGDLTYLLWLRQTQYNGQKAHEKPAPQAWKCCE